MRDPAIAFMVCFTVCFLGQCIENMWARWISYHFAEPVEDPEEIDDPDGEDENEEIVP